MSLLGLGRRQSVTRLGFAVMLKVFQRDGHFPTNIADVPLIAVNYIARQVDLDPALYDQYDWRSRVSTTTAARSVTTASSAKPAARICLISRPGCVPTLSRPSSA